VTPEGSAAAVVMLGIDGVRILEARKIDGEIELMVETTTDRAWCRICGVRARSKGRPTVVVEGYRQNFLTGPPRVFRTAVFAVIYSARC